MDVQIAEMLLWFHCHQWETVLRNGFLFLLLSMSSYDDIFRETLSLRFFCILIWNLLRDNVFRQEINGGKSSLKRVSSIVYFTCFITSDYSTMELSISLSFCENPKILLSYIKIQIEIYSQLMHYIIYIRGCIYTPISAAKTKYSMVYNHAKLPH